MTKNSKQFVTEIARAKNVILTYQFQRNGVALYKVTAYTEIVNNALKANTKNIKEHFAKLLTVK
jgi:hypothetical protein